MKKIAIIGSVNTDFTFATKKLPHPGETVAGHGFFTCFGGKGANEAVACARLGAKVMLFAKVGDDEMSYNNLKHLKKEGIDTSNIESAPGITGGVAGVMLGEKTNSIIVVGGANNLVDKKYVQQHEKHLLENDIFCLQLETPYETNEYLIDLLHKNNKIIIFNPSPITKLKASVINKCTYIIVNEVEIKYIPNYKSDEQILAKYKGKLILTYGKKGAYFYHNGEVVNSPAFDVGKKVDTTGAGDTFLGAFAMALSQNKPVDDAIKYANLCAGIKIMKKGAQTGMPTQKEVQKYDYLLK